MKTLKKGLAVGTMFLVTMACQKEELAPNTINEKKEDVKLMIVNPKSDPTKTV
jgi:hypothetical protein